MTGCSRCGTCMCSPWWSGWAAWSCSARSWRPPTFQVLQASAPENGRALAGELFGVDRSRASTTSRTPRAACCS